MTRVSDGDLNALLFGIGAKLVNVKCFTGDGLITDEELRGELHAAIVQRSSTASISKRFVDKTPKVDLRAVLTPLHN